MKIVKILLKVVLCLVVLVAVALLTLPLWFGPVVKTVANSVVPKVVKTEFNMGHLSLNPYTARFELGDTQLFNPTGCSEKYAVTLGDLAFDADTLSLMTDVIHIEEIKVKDVFVSVVKTPEGVGNFKQIQYNVAGGKEKYEAAQAEKQATAKELSAKEVPVKETKEKKETEKSVSNKKVIIDKLSISGVKIKLGPIPLSVPVDINLVDIGKESGGATLEETWQQIVTSVMNALGAAGEQLKALGNFTGDAAKAAFSKASGLATQTTETVGDLTSAASDSAAKATKAIGNVGDSVGEGAKKAMDSLKSLW